jgi:hypothetical protein
MRPTEGLPWRKQPQYLERWQRGQLDTGEQQMKLGDGSPWVGVLVGGLFLLILVPIILARLIQLLRGLLHLLGLQQAPKGSGSAMQQAAGLGRSSLQVFGFSLVACLPAFVLILGLVNYFPWVGTAHPAITGVLRAVVKDAELRAGLRRGVQQRDLALVELALTLGADPSDRQGRDSLLAIQSSAAIREALLRAGASPDGLPQQQAPLLSAFEAQDFELFEALLRAGAHPDPHTSDDPAPLLERMARRSPAQSQKWLQALLAGGAYPHRVLPGGRTVLDVLVLENLRPDWWPVLRSAGARHELLLDRGVALSAQHPALQHVRAWLDARATADVAGDPRWELPGASETGLYDDVPVAEAILSGRVLGDQALVQASGSGADGEPQHTVIALRRVQAEREPGLAVELEAPAEVESSTSIQGPSVGRPLSQATARSGPTSAPAETWRISGFWADLRPPAAR